jgi:hypothetical protein
LGCPKGSYKVFSAPMTRSDVILRAEGAFVTCRFQPSSRFVEL